MSDTPRPRDVDEPRMRAYLLGDLTPDERAELETRFFERDEEYERLLDVQYDLIDASVRDTLTPAERDAVTKRLLAHPEGQRRMLLARALSRIGAQPSGASITVPSTVAPLTSAWLAVAAVLTIASLGTVMWLTLDNARLRRELMALSSRPARVEPAAQTASTGPVPESLMADIALSPRVSRSDQGARVVEIPFGARLVRVQLAIDETASEFVVGVERSGAGRLSTQRLAGATANGSLVVWLPSEILESGTYEILLWRGREDADSLVGAYSFRVLRR